MLEIGAFYAQHEPAVLGFFLRRTRDPEVAADLTAETFAEVLAQLRRGVEVQEPRAWLFTLARGKLVDYQRRGVVADRARKRVGLERLEWTDEELERVHGAAADLEQALAALPDEQRAAVLGRVVDEHDYAHLARSQQATEPAVRQRVHRGLARLRQMLKESAP
jgi:RNA polymerase sigma-70 factor (ECF subfamily)